MTTPIKDIFASFDKIPCFTKQDIIFDGSRKSLDERIWRALKQYRILQLKKGFYITNFFYFHEPDKIKLQEFIASRIRHTSYLSLEYVLQKYHLLDGKYPITSISVKTNYSYQNFFGLFQYANLKKSLYNGFTEANFHAEKYHIATKAKALFDYLYLNSDLHRSLKYLKHQLMEKSGIQWDNFSQEDFNEFDQYVWKSNSKKMMRILHIISNHFEEKKFDSWAKKLLK